MAVRLEWYVIGDLENLGDFVQCPLVDGTSTQINVTFVFMSTTIHDSTPKSASQKFANYRD
jgi:hypothetical protein